MQTGRANQNDEQRLEGLLKKHEKDKKMHSTEEIVRVIISFSVYGVVFIAFVFSLATGPCSNREARPGRHGSGLGQQRYVIERTMAWLDNDRRLRICYERTWHSWQALHELSACVFCAKRLQDARKPPD